MNTQNHLIDDVYLARYCLLAGNFDSSIAICALWKDLERVTFTLDDLEHISLIGNLYTARGLSILLRGLWRMPSIRHLILWGPDTQHTGAALLSLWENGLNGDHAIDGPGISLDSALPTGAVDHLRQHVGLHDYRSIRDLTTLMRQIRGIKQLPPHAAPQVFPITEPEPPQTFPSAVSGWHIIAPTVAEGWTRLLDLIMRFGVVKESQYNIVQREILNVLTVVAEEDATHPHLPDYLPISADDLDTYIPSLLEDSPGSELSYTYGNRLRSYFGLDQIDTIVDKLRQAPHTRRAVAVLWDPESDPERDTPPCLTQVVVNVVDDHLYLTYVARSQDIVGAWPQNTLGMRTLQTQVARKLGLELGPITAHTVSAHIYEHDWEQAQHIIRERGDAHQALQFDPRGNFSIHLEDGQFVVELVDPEGQRVLWHARGHSSLELGKHIAALRLASTPDHYVYLGRELQRAEEALHRGEEYNQDRA